MSHPIRAVALLALRNEALYLPRCLEHLYHQGIETCIIDNGSTDESLDIAHAYRDKGVFRIEHLPFDGHYEWKKILRLKQELAFEIDAHWFIHHDADEIREAAKPHSTLLKGITAADKAGYNAVNFDEYVFVPTSAKEHYEGKDYVADMHYYHFIEPFPRQRLNAWKKTGEQVDLISSAGHQVKFPGLSVYPTPFILRHYIFLSLSHAIEKYGKRVFLLDEVKQGWHKKRAGFLPEQLLIPKPDQMSKLSSEENWDKTAPWENYDCLFGNPFR